MPGLGLKFAVIGVGKYGAEIANSLANKGAEVYAFDTIESKVEAMKENVSLAVTLDSTDKNALRSQNVQDCDVVVVSIGENFEATIITAVNLLELKVKRIIARASGPKQRLILEKIGIHEILTPENEVANVVTERLINPSIVSFLQLPDDFEIAEVKTPSALINKTVAEIGMRDKYKLTLVTLKRKYEIEKKGEILIEEHVLGVPTSNTRVQETDTLVVFGTTKNIERLIEINQ